MSVRCLEGLVDCSLFAREASLQGRGRRRGHRGLRLRRIKVEFPISPQAHLSAFLTPASFPQALGGKLVNSFEMTGVHFHWLLQGRLISL